MKHLSIILLATTALTSFAHAQTAQQAGDWQKIPGGMALDGCLTMPLAVTSGCMGPGSINAHAYYLNGQPLFGGESGVLSVLEGGTGANNAPQALINLGAAASGANSDITALLALSTPIAVAQGGTGANNPSAARANLNAAASGANNDLTSITGLTTPLSVAQGGTGGATPANARSGIGAAASGPNTDITSLLGLTTPLATYQGGTGAVTPMQARGNLGGLFVSPIDYGGVCNGQSANGTADTNAMNSMFAALRGLPNNAMLPMILMPGNSFYNTPVGSACYIISSINATSASNGADALSSQNKLLILGGRLECHTTGTPCWDMSGSTWFHFVGTVFNAPVNTADEPSYGLQIARIHLLQGAGAHTFDHVTVQGGYTRAAIMDFASEENVWINLQASNNDSISPTANYTFLDDGCNHFNVKSQFQNIDIPVSTLTSYVQQTFLGGSVTSGSNQPNMIAPLFVCGTMNHQFKNMYIHTANQYAVHYFGVSSGNPMQSEFDLHVEGNPISVFLFENNSTPTESYYGFKFKDHSTNPTQSVISVAGAHIPLTTATIHNFDIDIARFGQNPTTVQLFDNPSVFSIDGGTVRLPSINNWKPTSNVNWINGSYTSETICLADQVPSCETPSQVPIINLNPDFLIDQAHEASVSTPSNGSLVVDGWREEDDGLTFVGSNAGPMTFQQGTTVLPDRPFVAFYSLQGTVANSQSTAAGSFYDINTMIEGGDMSQLRWGWGAQAQPTILQYCAESSVAPFTLPIYLAAVSSNLHYYNIDDTILTANQWACFTHMIRGEMTGTTDWSAVTNKSSLKIGVTLADAASDPTCMDGVWQTVVCRSTPASTQLINQPNGTTINLTYFHFYKGFSQRPPIVDSYSVQLQKAQRRYRKSLRVGYIPGVTLPGQGGAISYISPYAYGASVRTGTRVDWPNMFSNRGNFGLANVVFYSPSVAGSNKCYNYSQSRETGVATALNVSESGMVIQCGMVAGDAVSDLIGIHYAIDSGY